MIAGLAIFAFIILLSIALAIWARFGHNVSNIEEYIVGGRAFGSFLVFFLAVGEIYSIGTLVGLPGAIYAKGASYGLWFMGYILLAYPIGYFLAPLMWRAAVRYKALTLSDIFKSHYSSRAIEIVSALLLFAFLIPWAELQFVGLQVALDGLHFHITPVPAVIITAVLAGVYIVISGVRSPAMISILKDILLFGTIVGIGLTVAFTSGGVAHIFESTAVNKPALMSIPDTKAMTFALTTILLQSFAFMVVTSQFVLTGKSESALKHAYIFMPLYMLMYPFLIIVAYYAVQQIPTLDHPNSALFAIATQVMPQWAIGIIAGAAALSGLLVLAAQGLFLSATFARNITPNLNPSSQRRLTQILIVVYLAVGAVLTLLIPQLMLNLITIAYDFAAQLLVPMIGFMFIRKVGGTAYTVGLIVGGIVTLALNIMKPDTLGISAGLIGIVANAVAVAIAGAVLPEKAPNTPAASWDIREVGTASQSQTVKEVDV